MINTAERRPLHPPDGFSLAGSGTSVACVRFSAPLAPSRIRGAYAVWVRRRHTRPVRRRASCSAAAADFVWHGRKPRAYGFPCPLYPAASLPLQSLQHKRTLYFAAIRGAPMLPYWIVSHAGPSISGADADGERRRDRWLAIRNSRTSCTGRARRTKSAPRSSPRSSGNSRPPLAPVLPDPAANPRLRAAVLAARQANMPKDTVDRAIKRGSGGGADDAYEEVRYEGYGPGGVAVIVEALTDNRNRTASEVRAAFTKSGGALGETNSVSFMFDRVGEISYPPATASADDMFEAAIEAGARDIESDAEQHLVTCAPEDLNAVRDALENRFGPPVRRASSGVREPLRKSTRKRRRASSSCSRRSRTATMSRTSTPISKWPKT